MAPLLLGLTGDACCPRLRPGDDAAVLRGHVSPELGPRACALELHEAGHPDRTLARRPVAGEFRESFAVGACPATYTVRVLCGRRVRRVLSFRFPREGTDRRPIHLGWIF